MADFYVDSTTGDDGDNGSTMALAFATIEFYCENARTVGDKLWVRRIHDEFGGGPPGDDIEVTTDGTPENPISIIGWPRASDASITSASWTNGSTTVDLIVGLSMDYEKHCGRFVVGPDGSNYLITVITDANTIVIDREYAGSTVTGASGACTIMEDEDYDDRPTDTASWDDDPDDLTIMDFQAASFQFNFSADYCWIFKNIKFMDTADASGFASMNSCKQTHWEGCLFNLRDNIPALYPNRTLVSIERCIFVGTGVGASQRVAAPNSNSVILMKNSAAYNMGDNGLNFAMGGYLYCYNVNIGVEVANGDADIEAGYGNFRMEAVDLTLGGTNGDVDIYTYVYPPLEASIENYGKVLGAHKTWNGQGTITKLPVVGGSGDPYKRSAGADDVLEILYNDSGTIHGHKSSIPEWLIPVFTHEFEATTDSRRYRYYVQAEGAVLASELWIEVEYVSAYDDATEYVIKKVTSDEGITIRGGVSDWSQYIEVEDIKPAVGSTVRIKCYCSFYDATDKIYIDPLCEVTT